MKNWYESKTLWINGLLFVAALATLIANWIGELTAVPDSAAWWGLVQSVVNLVLRTITTQPVQLIQKKRSRF